MTYSVMHGMGEYFNGSGRRSSHSPSEYRDPTKKEPKVDDSSLPSDVDANRDAHDQKSSDNTSSTVNNVAVRGHAFLSYVREDESRIDGIALALREAGIPIWRDTNEIWPGEVWTRRIRDAIIDQTLVFVAFFSTNLCMKETSYQREELNVAVEELRKRDLSRVWFIPVRLDECDLPHFEIGGINLNHFHRVDLFGPNGAAELQRLIDGIKRVGG